MQEPQRNLQKEYELEWHSILWKLIRPVLVFVIALFISLLIFLQGGLWLTKKYFYPVDKSNKTEVSFTVKKGESLSSVARHLEKEGFIKNRHVFKYYTDFKGLGQKIQAGEYLLSKSMSLNQISNLLTSGGSKSLTTKITVIPGQTVEDVAEYLFAQRIILNKNEFLNLCKTGEDFKNYYFIDELYKSNMVQNRKYVLEGYLSPNTYEIFTNATTKEIIAKLLTQTDIVFSESYHNRATQLGITMDEVLTLASVIEKEAKKADFTKVSAVFHNRLRQGMKLQSDVTVHYVTNVRRMKLNKDDISVNSPYNTYLFTGLPIGPICNPSADAIYAALFPDEQFVADNYLYFCSKDPNNGELAFSKTLQEHEQAVKLYAPLWEAFDKSRGF